MVVVKGIARRIWAFGVLVSVLLFSRAATATMIGDITFTDAALKTCLTSAGFTDADDVSSVIRLTCHDLGITSIDGLQYFTSLETLDLFGNDVTDLTPIAGLTSLHTLYLSYDKIVDISPIAGLVNLQDLSLDSNDIQDVSALAGLTKLQYLGIRYNKISDVSVLSNLTALKSASVGGNQISDLSSLGDLPNLTQVIAYDNHLTQLPTWNNIGNLSTVDITNNAITDFSGLSSWPSTITVYSDIDRPVISSLSLTPNPLDVGDNGANLSVNLTFSPALTGNYIYLGLTDASNTQLVKFMDYYTGDPMDVGMSAYATKDNWHLEYLSVGSYQYNDFALAQFGANEVTVSGPQSSDTTPPTVTGIAISATPGADITNAPSIINVNITAADDYAGVANQCLAVATMADPAGNNMFLGCLHTGDTSLRTFAIGPQAVGTWHINKVHLVDKVGNIRDYTEDQLKAAGLSTTFEVTGNPVAAAQPLGVWPDTSALPDPSPAKPYYEFDVTATSYVGITLDGNINQREMTIYDSAGNVVGYANTVYVQQLDAGHYRMFATHTSATSEAYTLSFYGPISNVVKDTDGDGTIDTKDSDIDGDGIPNTIETTQGLDPYSPDGLIDPDGDGFTTLQEVVAGTDWNDVNSAPALQSIDVDGDGTVQALSDGTLILRHMFGFTGSNLVDGAVPSTCCTRSNAEIESDLQGLTADLDVDGNGQTDPLTDGLLLMRSLMGFSGASLVINATAADCTRCTPEFVQTYTALLSLPQT